ncbi:GNAT family N-acetyltransferase [Salinibius halmophilus]|uniref:GNAT family N-acetyltransferase n=1 Tax=Salinibius halmophilus TaxID=1853216 RepID=UPI0013144508|nr:GNAT family N-acetyltransferase [Salinibius halmophilus]
MFIRQATLADIDSIAELHIHSWRTAYASLVPAATLAAMKEHEYSKYWQNVIATSQGKLLLAMNHGALQGFCHFERDDSTATIKSIHVHPSQYRQGIASMLLTRTLTELSDDACFNVLMWTFQKNQAGIEFLQHHGFSFDGQQDRNRHDNLAEMRFKKGLPRL